MVGNIDAANLQVQLRKPLAVAMYISAFCAVFPKPFSLDNENLLARQSVEGLCDNALAIHTTPGIVDPLHDWKMLM